MVEMDATFFCVCGGGGGGGGGEGGGLEGSGSFFPAKVSARKESNLKGNNLLSKAIELDCL